MMGSRRKIFLLASLVSLGALAYCVYTLVSVTGSQATDAAAWSEQIVSAQIEALSPDDIQNIVVYDSPYPETRKETARVSAPEQLAAFVEALRDHQPWQPDHPSAKSRIGFAVNLKSGAIMEYDAITQADASGEFFVDAPIPGCPPVQFRSRALFSWFAGNGLL